MNERSFRWLLVALWVNAILWSVPYARTIGGALIRGGAGRWALGGGGVLFGAFALTWATLASRREWRRAAPSLLLCAAAYAAIVWYLRAIPDEVVHLAEYGVLALLLLWALGTSAGAPWLAGLATGAVGFLEEITQGVTPLRFFDWRDVLVNLAAGALPLWLASVHRRSMSGI